MEEANNLTNVYNSKYSSCFHLLRKYLSSACSAPGNIKVLPLQRCATHEPCPWSAFSGPYSRQAQDSRPVSIHVCNDNGLQHSRDNICYISHFKCTVRWHLVYSHCCELELFFNCSVITSGMSVFFLTLKYKFLEC